MARQAPGDRPAWHTENAKRAYEDALLVYKDKDYLDASTRFREVRRKFAFSEYAPLAQLRLADIEFDQEKWIESISAYKGFVRENPKHRESAWARMRIARGYYNQISDALLLPDQAERDQSAVKEAAREILSYVEDYPDGPQVAQMKDLYADALARLVAHELYIARFYQKKGKLDAALARVSYAVTKYKGSRKDVEALVLQGEILLMLKRKSEARGTFQYIVTKYPNDPRTDQAKKYLAEIDATH
ncbi:MAG: outer membrane protein assembly factor BamD [Myxococcales bacterium]|nr:outer membrane protein assembly factor BamD [Myxococcales bacterium]